LRPETSLQTAHLANALQIRVEECRQQTLRIMRVKALRHTCSGNALYPFIVETQTVHPLHLRKTATNRLKSFSTVGHSSMI
jgi:hypothetical protein